MEHEKGRREATADMSEDLSEGEKGDTAGDTSVQSDSNRGRMPRIGSLDTMVNWATHFKDKKLYIVLIRQDLGNMCFDYVFLSWRSTDRFVLDVPRAMYSL